MPHIAGGSLSGESSTPRLVIADERVEVAGASGDHDDFPGAKVLHKKTEWVKFYRARIVFSKLTNKNKTSNNSGRE